MNLKTLLFVFVGLLAVAGVVVAMNLSSGSQTTFQGGTTGSKLPRAIPEGRANPFDVVPAAEADSRATSNNTLAREALVGTDTRAYTAAPVIQLEGTSGDNVDPMADAIVSQNEPSPTPEPRTPVPVGTISDLLEIVKAPDVDYQVEPQQIVEEAPVVVEQAPEPDPNMLNLLMSLTQQNQGPNVVIDSFDQGPDRGSSPMQSQDFRN